MNTAALVSAFFLLGPAVPLQSDDPGWTGVLDEAAFAALHELKEGAAPAPLGEDIEIDGSAAYLALPPEGIAPIGALVVIHEWWGLNGHVKHWTDRLASDGYVALAVDLYGGEVATTRERASELMRGVDDAAALKTMRAAHAWLTDPEGALKAERTGSIGWCFGGGRSLQLAQNEPGLDAAVVYYGRLVTDPDELAPIEAPLLGIFGTKDQGIPPASVAAFENAMKEAGKEVEIRSYEAEHAFANPSSARYDAEAAAAAWHETRSFLVRNLWPEQPEGTFVAKTRALEADVPDGWEAGRESSMRIASFTVAGTCDVSVIPLGRDGGGLKSNLDRWAMQVGKDALTDDEVAALPRIPMLGVLTPVFRAEGKLRDMGGVEIEEGAVLAVFALLEGEALSVKMSGPEGDVAAHADEFLRYCRSLR